MGRDFPALAERAAKEQTSYQTFFERLLQCEFVKPFKRDYARIKPCANAATVIAAIDGWLGDYNRFHPHRGLKTLSPHEFNRLNLSPKLCSRCPSFEEPTNSRPKETGRHVHKRA